MSRPFHARSLLLQESHYTLDSSGDKTLMGLYALYTLWWEEGSGKESYGYHPDTFQPSRREDIIGKAFEDCLSVVAKTLLEECREALFDEASNVFDMHLINPETVLKWARSHEFVRALHSLGARKGMSYQDYAMLFSAPFWEDECDLYGGKKWADISLAVMNLDAEFRRGNSVSLMGAVDRLLDLEHNTGSLGSKLTKMKVSKRTLDLRAGFTCSKDFLPYVSGPIARLIRRD